MENQELIPIIGTGLSHGMEYLLSVIGGISPMDVGGNIFTIQYQWIMFLALPLILSYNHQRGKKCKYLFLYFLSHTYNIALAVIEFCFCLKQWNKEHIYYIETSKPKME